MDAAYHLQVFDIELIYSWTPREFKNLIKGAQLRRIDEFEMAAIQAMYGRTAANAKKLKLTDLYDAKKARERLENGTESKKAPLDLERYRKAQAAMKAWSPQILNKQKGG